MKYNLFRTLVAVFAMAAMIFAVSCDKTADDNGNNGQTTRPDPEPKPVPDGALCGIFSVSENTHVYFSKGNLQYTTTGTHAVADGGTAPGTWRFATWQWDTIGAANSNVSSSYTGWIDLFCWGTSGWNSGAVGYQPYFIEGPSSNYYPGGSYTNDLTGEFANADWGVYNAISNGGNRPGLWRTLSEEEWGYLEDSRNTASGVRYALATVCGIHGLILTPDNWKTETYALNDVNNYLAEYDANVLTAAQWGPLELAGCIFLPAAGYRRDTSLYRVGSWGHYWTTTSNTDYFRWSFEFTSGGVFRMGNYPYIGSSVRLVCSAD